MYFLHIFLMVVCKTISIFCFCLKKILVGGPRTTSAWRHHGAEPSTAATTTMGTAAAQRRVLWRFGERGGRAVVQGSRERRRRWLYVSGGPRTLRRAARPAASIPAPPRRAGKRLWGRMERRRRRIPWWAAIWTGRGIAAARGGDGCGDGVAAGERRGEGIDS